MKKVLTLVSSLALAVGSFACQKQSDEFRDALPNREVLEVQFPEQNTTQQGLMGENQSALVGGPAHYYTTTYYESRNINAFGKHVLNILEAITVHEPTQLSENMAVWGPFSDENEPNEFRLVVERVEIAILHYRWLLQGKHKSGGEEAYINLAAGALEPDTDPEHGMGWFVVDFDNIKQLNPAENSNGQIAYAYVVNAEGVQVRVVYNGPNDTGDNITAAYAYGKAEQGGGFMVFALPEDLHGGNAQEALVIRTRWNADHTGRADVVATWGDLGPNVIHASQCWDTQFTSTYEGVRLNGAIVEEDGDATTCTLDEEIPEDNELPSIADIENPYEGEGTPTGE